MRNFPLLSLGLGLLLASCGNDTHTASTATDPAAAAPAVKADPSSALDDTATRELISLVGSYYSLKDALVASDAAKADAAAGRLLSEADAFRQTAAKQPDPSTLQPHLEEIRLESEALANSKADSIETKRAHFSRISDAMFALLRAAELRNGGIYQQFCPMAFNDKGGYWLSPEAEIRNPYYGKKMLECGEVRDSL